MNRRYVVVIAGAVLTPIALSAACAFPAVSFVADDAGVGTTSDEASVRCGCAEEPDGSATSAADANDARPPPPAVFVPEGRPDGGARIADASVCADRTPCDCDDDGYAAISCPVDAGTIMSSRGEPLKPGDCDDLDPLRFPGQTFLAVGPEPPENGDWNCDGVAEPDHTPVGLCEGTGATGCIGGDAGVLDFQCGAQKPWMACQPDRSNDNASCFWQPTGENVTIRCR